MEEINIPAIVILMILGFIFRKVKSCLFTIIFLIVAVVVLSVAGYWAYDNYGSDFNWLGSE